MSVNGEGSSSASSVHDVPKSLRARQDGNAAFRKGKWVASIGHYTDAAIHDPSDSIAYSNRAQAYLKLDKFLDAERDCTTALSLQSDSVKALYRRALSRKGVGRFAQAIQDLETLLTLDSSNVSALEEMKELHQLQGEEQSKRVQPTAPKVPSRVAPQNHNKESSTQSAAASIDNRTEAGSSSFAAIRKNREVKKSSFVSMPANTEAAANAIPTSSISETPVGSRPSFAGPAAAELDPPPVTATVGPGAGLEILRHVARCSPTEAWAYLAMYPPAMLPAMLSSLLDPEALGSVLPALAYGASIPQDRGKVLTIVEGLRATPRWKMNVAMLSASERAAGAMAWATAGGEGSWS